VISITKKKLIIVSNREPYVHRKNKEEILYKKSLSGVISALGWLAREEKIDSKNIIVLK